MFRLISGCPHPYPLPPGSRRGALHDASVAETASADAAAGACFNCSVPCFGCVAEFILSPVEGLCDRSIEIPLFRLISGCPHPYPLPPGSRRGALHDASVAETASADAAAGACFNCSVPCFGCVAEFILSPVEGLCDRSIEIPLFHLISGCPHPYPLPPGSRRGRSNPAPSPVFIIHHSSLIISRRIHFSFITPITLLGCVAFAMRLGSLSVFLNRAIRSYGAEISIP